MYKYQQHVIRSSPLHLFPTHPTSSFPSENSLQPFSLNHFLSFSVRVVWRDSRSLIKIIWETYSKTKAWAIWVAGRDKSVMRVKEKKKASHHWCSEAHSSDLNILILNVSLTKFRWETHRQVVHKYWSHHQDVEKTETWVLLLSREEGSVASGLLELIYNEKQREE